MSFYNSNTIQSSLFLFFLCFIYFLPPVLSVSFKIQRFTSGDANIIYEGDAVASVGVVQFNRINYHYRVGRVKYARPVPLWDSSNGKLSDFSTHFSFTIDALNSPTYASGLAFFLAPVEFPIPPNSGGGFLGLFNTTTTDATKTQNPVVAIEFDTFMNKWDPPFPHIGINVNSLASVAYVSWNFSLYSGKKADAWIKYNASTKNLSVFLTYLGDDQESFRVSHVLDLMKILPEWVSIGFSAATSYRVERHQLHFWEFNSSMDVAAKVNGSNGKKSTGSNGKKSTGLILGGVLVPVAIILICVVVVAWMRRKKAKKREETINLTSMNTDFETGFGPKKFSYEELVSATQNFAIEEKLGEGGFGQVYRGFFANSRLEVAVKRISKSSKQGKREYITEVKIISQLRHRNLVQFIGWCHDRGQFLLVYEFMPNRSLDIHLFKHQTPLMTWATRYKITLGLASALLYLHEEWEQCVVHRDIKSSNVMLDSSFNAKLGDFGLARLMDHELGLPQTTGLAGTLGYMAPEYFRTGRASKESDVFSFGVVALEIACGRKAVDSVKENAELGLVDWVWGLYENGRVIDAADERLRMEFDDKQMVCLLVVGLWCSHPSRRLRPGIKQAIQVLNFEVEMPEKVPSRLLYHELGTCQPGHSREPSITLTSLQLGR